MTRRKNMEDVVRFWAMAREWLQSYLPKVRRASTKTIEAYRASLENLIGFLEAERGMGREEIGFGALGRPTVKGWVAWMNGEKGYSAKTVNLRLTALKSFLRYCSAEDPSLTAEYVGVCAVRPPKVARKPVGYLRPDETKALLSAYSGRTAKERRNRAMLVLLYETGARVSELTGIRVSDLSLEAPARVTLIGKGGKWRAVPLGDACAAHMRVYMDEFHSDAKPGDPLFFCVRDGARRALSTDAVSLVLKNAGEAARASCPGMPSLHCHLIRKTRAMDLYQAGVPLPLVAQLLGHESVSTTSGFYAFATDDMMAEAVRAAAPISLSSRQQTLARPELHALYRLD
ncbi:MAG: tyrosine-type recombinase/integrase [Kiritimatiellae bacterium]|nr:tyrosine-type recombinase/integrase [Kiritimatiellia bacterium]